MTALSYSFFPILYKGYCNLYSLSGKSPTNVFMDEEICKTLSLKYDINIIIMVITQNCIFFLMNISGLSILSH